MRAGQGPAMFRLPLPGTLALLVLLLLLGRWIAPAVDIAVRLHRADGDPVATSDILLRRSVDGQALGSAIDDALATGDADLADSLVALGDRQGVQVDTGRREAVAQANESSPLETGWRFARGAVVGDVSGGVGLAGALAGDLVGIGDIRDLSREAWRMSQGEEADTLVLGLAAAGLAVTAATWASAGEAAPIRGGLSLIKSLRKAGRLSRPMVESMGRLVHRAVDGPQLAASARSLGRLDIGAARKAAASSIRPSMIAPVAAMGRDAVRLSRRGGVRALEDAAALVRSPAELSRAARLSEGFGRATRGTLKLLGPAALAIGSTVVMIAGWMLAACCYVLLLALWAARFGRRLARIHLRAARPRKAPGRADHPQDASSGRAVGASINPEPLLLAS
jgi:hypothetical protein